MDSFEANKIFGAVLGTVFVLFGGSILAEGIFHSEAPETPGYLIVAAEAPAAGEAEGEAEVEQPIAVLLASASAEEGASQFRKCTACHSADEGGPNKVGPVLWDIVNRPVASIPDFGYSAAMQEFSEGGAVNWTFDHLNPFLADPQAHVPGTTMGFAGIQDDADRADLLLYLSTLSANPAPLPEPPAPVAETAEGAAPAEVGTTAPAATTAAEGQEQPQSPGTTDTATAVATPAPVTTMVPATGETAGAGTAGAPTGGNTTAPAAQGTVAPGAPGQPAAAPAAPATPAPATPAAAGAAAPAAPAATAPAAPAAVAPAVPAPAAPAAAGAPAAPAPAEGAAATPPAASVQVAGLPASADPAAGQQIFRRCMACHSAEEGGPNKIGPALYGVFGRPVAALADYSYSPAMVEYSQGGAVVWDYEHLASFLEDPRAVVPGTKMVFPGVKDAADRDNLIAYLQSLGGAAQ